MFEAKFQENNIIQKAKFIPHDNPEPTEAVFLVVQEEASFPGGNAKWTNYLKKNLQYPRRAALMGLEGPAFLQFTVDQAGHLSNIEVIRVIGADCVEEAIRVLRKSPQWTSGKQRGIPVKS